MNDIVQYVQQLVGEGNAEDALNFLLKKSRESQPFLVNDIFMLKGQYSNGKKDYLLDVLSREEFDRFIARLNLAILNIALKFNTAIINNSEQQCGKLLYKIPSKMLVNNEYKCVIRIAYNDEIILKDIKIDNDISIKDIRIAEIMSVELVDINENKVFNIRTFTDEEQFIISEDYTQWIFQVKPILQGNFPLVLKVAVVEVIKGKERKRNIVFEKRINITNDYINTANVDFEMLNASFTIDIPKNKLQKDVSDEYGLTEEQKEACHKIIHSAAVASAAVGAVAVPGADSAIVIPVQIGMAIELGKALEINLTVSEAKGIILGINATLFGKGVFQELVGWIPVIGKAVKASTAAAITEALGWEVVQEIKNIKRRQMQHK